MVQLYLYVEGQTEQEFARTVLTPHLAGFGVYLMGAVLAEFNRGKGRVHLGGVTKYGPFRRGLIELMKQHDRPGVAFSTMLDYCKYPTDAPGWADAVKLTDPPQRVAALQDALANDTDSRRLIPHIQLHEFEALLFTDPTCLGFTHPGQPAALAALRQIASEFSSPEDINDGELTAPSKRILQHIPDYEKVLAGSETALLIGLQAIRDKCPHFDAWVQKLERLATTTTPP